MDLTHHFRVPASVDDTWAAFNDLQRIGSCLPGATITSVDGDEFTGSVKVKLGPISLQYNGTGSYTERDESARRVVIVAKGKDKRGNGTASATITASLAADGSGTAVDVVTDLSITGKPAQFGRGVIQDVSDKLLGQFVDCIQSKLTPAADEDAADEDAAGESGAAQEFPRDESPVPPSATDTLAPAESPAPEPPAPERTAPERTAPAETGDRSAPRGSGAAGSGAAVSGPAESGPAVAGPPAGEIDLMSTVAPVLLKRYAKPVLEVAAVLGIVLVLRRLFGGSSD